MEWILRLSGTAGDEVSPPWQWKQYKFGNNLMELKTHYEKEDVGRTLWTPGRDATTVTKKLPKMIQIPLE